MTITVERMERGERGMDCLSADEWLFFAQYRDMLPIYEQIRRWLASRYDDVSVKVGKTAISLRNRHVFATVSLPWRRVKDWPPRYLLVSIGLPYCVESPRVRCAVQPYPHRWTHHILLESEEAFDEELQGWLDEAYAFALSKSRASTAQ